MPLHSVADNPFEGSECKRIFHIIHLNLFDHKGFGVSDPFGQQAVRLHGELNLMH